MERQKDDPHHCATLLIDGDGLSIEDVIDVARRNRKVQLSAPAKDKMANSRAWVDQILDEGKLTVYGLTTGYGSLAELSIPPKDVEALTCNVIMSHSAGVGPPLAEEVVRATMLIRANTLAKGYSGIRAVVLERLLAMLNQGLHPVMPEKGSLGASGDLAPLAHLALALSEGTEGGQAFYEGQLLDAGEAMRRAGIEQIVLKAKEGLALINGSTVSAALAAVACHDAETLLKNAEICLAMSLEAMKGVSDAFHESVHVARGHEGQKRSAANVRSLIRGSELVDSTDRVQDAYSVRCGPQVIGAVRDVLAFVRHTVSIEINAATDNPLIVLDLPESRENKAISCGNFHGEPLALAMDLLGMAVAEIGSISERRTFRLLDKTLSAGLPAMLVQDSGLNSGLMMAQYTAAALVSENKTLAHPDSVDSIPTSANQEDHVSMSMNAALHAREIVKNVEQVVGIEMLCAAQALDFRYRGLEFSSSKWLTKEESRGHKKLVEYDLDQGTAVAKARAGKGTEAAYRAIRGQIDHLSKDRPLYPDLQRIAAMVRSGEIIEAAETALGASLLGSADITVKAI
ncbi:MAG TPA: histidine ammonia-lyase [Anaerolineae bacterium]|nr:histidine ammonia-lyase [Anaerolineae bacterium]